MRCQQKLAWRRFGRFVMSDSLVAALVAIFLWWFTTGAILLVVTSLGQKRLPLGLTVAAMLLGSMALLLAVSDETTKASAFLSFLGALGVWGAVEISFLGGLITGPNRQELPSHYVGLQRFWAATRVVLWHELFILAIGAFLLGSLAFWANKIGIITFAVLWVMRLSAKLNLYLGVRNTGERLLPVHLRYISSYFALRRMNLLFPFSITLGTILSAWLFHKAFANDANEYQAIGFMLVAMLASLAVLEHWFLMLPLPLEALWHWGLRGNEDPKQTTTWSTELTGPFDMKPLAAVVARVTAGAFGTIESLKGSIRAPEGWLVLDFVDGVMHLRRHGAPEAASTGIIVTGRFLNERGICAEFENYALRYSA